MDTVLRKHNLWLSEVMLTRESCPTCGIKLELSNSIVGLGGYASGRYYHGAYACRECFVDQINKTFKRGVYNLLVRSGCNVRWLTGNESVTVGA